MTEIQLTPTPYKVFAALVDAPGHEISYTELKNKSGMADISSFPRHIQELVAKGLIQCLGNHRSRYVVLKANPADVVEVERYSRKTSQHSKPLSEAVKKRKCLSCQKTFKSEWVGMRICGDCKLTPAWQGADNPYTPECDTEETNVSGLSTGILI
ncbi:hypothetical protein WH95_18470 [Kiloniella litopenaei]|uniref:Uncharacterized protein n=1 Tax=Kiloniella litopenaei TaxID=1549748 RepID=A0A0M2R0K8_9PROT|nr:hypothetical protein [Kiloniella litopenaei]KKJ75427.1 hypothetical protein WH95_18470 [Kiloniella litopenaei]